MEEEACEVSVEFSCEEKMEELGGQYQDELEEGICD